MREWIWVVKGSPPGNPLSELPAEEWIFTVDKTPEETEEEETPKGEQ